MKNHQDTAAKSSQINNHLDSAVKGTWTDEEDRRFEYTLADVPEDDPERWQKKADAVPGKTAEQVRVHYEKLMRDVDDIDAGLWDHVLPTLGYEHGKCEKDEGNTEEYYRSVESLMVSTLSSSQETPGGVNAFSRRKKLREKGQRSSRGGGGGGGAPPSR